MIAKAVDSNRASDPRNQAGLEAERKMAFYLRRAFEHERDAWVFNDLRLVRNEDAAQIDHLVLHRSGMVLVESKSVTGEIAVNHRGEWTRRAGGREQGMESPVIQARLQAKFLLRLMSENDDRVLDGQLRGLLPKHFNRNWPIDIIVAVSDTGRISRSVDVPEVMKADQVAGMILAIVRRHKRGRFSPNPLNMDGTYVLTGVEMGRLVSFLLKSHAPLDVVGRGTRAAPPPAATLSDLSEPLHDQDHLEKLRLVPPRLAKERGLAATSEVSRPDSVRAQPSVREALTVAVPPPMKSTRTRQRPAHPIGDDTPLRRRLYNGDRPIDIVKELKIDYPDHIVFIQNGFFWEVYEEDADVCSRLFGWKIASHGTGHTFTGVPVNAFKFKQRLEDKGLSYIMVAQTEYPSNSGYVERAPVELFRAQEA